MKRQFSKNDFISIIDKLQIEADTVSELYRKYSIDIIGCEWYQSDYYLVKVLSWIFEDDDEWIDWWCWETDFGRYSDYTTITYKDGTEKTVATAADLYDFLVENMKHKEDN